MHFIDRVLLLGYSDSAVAASTPASMLFWNVTCLALGTCAYVNTFVSQYHGARHNPQIGRIVWQGTWLALISTPFILAVIPLAPWAFNLSRHAPDVVEQEIVYFQILCVSGPFTLLASVWAGFFSGRGQTRVVMLADFMAASVNVTLDWCWIYGKAGFPAWGIAGAGWATVVALGVKALFLGVLMLREPNRRRYSTASAWRLNGPLLARLLRFGLPSGVQMMLDVTGYTAFLFLIGNLGRAELAATNITWNISMLAFMPVWGLGMAVGIIVGQRLGENREDLATRAAWNTLLISELYMLVASAFFLAVPEWFLFGYQATSAQSDRELRSLAAVFLRFVAAYNLFDALNMVFVNVLKGAGDTLFVLFVSLVMATALAGGSYLVVEVWRLGVNGSWCYLTLWLGVLGAIYLGRFLHGAWRSKRVIATSDWQGEPPAPLAEGGNNSNP